MFWYISYIISYPKCIDMSTFHWMNDMNTNDITCASRWRPRNFFNRGIAAVQSQKYDILVWNVWRLIWYFLYWDKDNSIFLNYNIKMLVFGFLCSSSVIDCLMIKGNENYEILIKNIELFFQYRERHVFVHLHTIG